MKKISSVLICLMLVVYANAQSWVTIPTGSMATFYSCSFGDASTIYIVGTNGADSATIMKSTNGGASFYHLSASFIAPGNIPKSICFTSRDTGFISGGVQGISTPVWTSGFIYKTTNGGLSWSPVVTTAPTVLERIQFPGKLIGYASGGYNCTSVIYKTTDGGNTWAPIFTSSSPISLLGSWVLDDTTGYVTGIDNTALQAKVISVASGVVVSNVNFSAYSGFQGVGFVSRDTGVASANVSGTSGTSFSMVKTTDGGSTWSPVHTSTRESGCIKFANRMVGYAVGDENLVTIDGGNTWSTFAPWATSSLGSVFWMDVKSSVGIIVGEAGMIARNASVTAIPGLQQAQQEQELYPNPFSTATHISFREEQTNTAISITNVTGREVRKMSFSGKELIVEKGELLPGGYILTASSDKGFNTIRFVIQ